MLILPVEGADASTVSSAVPSTASSGLPNDPRSGGGGRDRHQVSHMLFGTPSVVQATILRLHQLGYADPTEWSRPIQ